MELFKAHRQWATRPDDERFNSIQEVYNVCREYAINAREKEVSWDSLRLEANGPDVQLVGKAGIPANLSNWAFGQVCARLEAPARYLRNLPARLAVLIV